MLFPVSKLSQAVPALAPPPFRVSPLRLALVRCGDVVCSVFLHVNRRSEFVFGAAGKLQRRAAVERKLTAFQWPIHFDFNLRVGAFDGANDPGQYDQELFLAVRDWEPYFTANMDDDDDDTHDGPLLEKPAVMNTEPDGLEVGSMTYSINDKALGSGDPIRVREGQRLLVHFLNASAIENRRIAMAGHKMRVIAMDGNAAPAPQLVDSIFLGAGERIDAEIEMKNPGIWILGSTEKPIRDAGLGVVVEYGGQRMQPQWVDPPKTRWDYSIFGSTGWSSPPAQQTIEMTFEKIPGGAGKFNLWLVNGKPYPHDREFVLQEGVRYRLVMHNRTDDAHPMHLHRHLWELKEINGKAMAGVIKDTVVVPYYGRATVDFTADRPGLALFNCHIQQHMDYGFKALFRYA